MAMPTPRETEIAFARIRAKATLDQLASYEPGHVWTEYDWRDVLQLKQDYALILNEAKTGLSWAMDFLDRTGAVYPSTSDVDMHDRTRSFLTSKSR
jgi:hypothetical protein